MRYALVTAVYNEGQHLESTIAAVASQTLLPVRWVVVDDGSTDRTADIVQQHARTLPFIELVRLDRHLSHSFVSKVRALNEGLRLIDTSTVDFVGNVDGDVSFEPSYFSAVIGKFAGDPTLGIGGGEICEWNVREYRPRIFNSRTDVAGAVQMFRRECYEAVGEFLPLRYGGEDWCSQVTARMKGWRVESFPGLRVRHHRPTGGARGWLRLGLRQGLMDFSLGSHPVFELARIARRMRLGGAALAAVSRLAGFAWGYCSGKKRVVSREFVEFMRAEEMRKLRGLGRRTVAWTRTA